MNAQRLRVHLLEKYPDATESVTSKILLISK